VVELPGELELEGDPLPPITEQRLDAVPEPLVPEAPGHVLDSARFFVREHGEGKAKHTTKEPSDLVVDVTMTVE
jgi:hypothetical protein